MAIYKLVLCDIIMLSCVVLQVESRIVRSMCADLMFAFFICPAICDPEPYGITSDAPISYIANNNLMQVAQILQVLALPDLDGVDAKTRDLYEKFPKVSKCLVTSRCNGSSVTNLLHTYLYMAFFSPGTMNHIQHQIKSCFWTSQYNFF